jgi:hypothetical protein
MSEIDPQVQQSLERLVGRTVNTPRDWEDVVSRARAARRRRAAVAILSGVLVIAGVSTAFAYAPGLRGLIAGTPVSPNRLSPEEKLMLASMSSGTRVLATKPNDPRLRRLGGLVSIRLLANRGGYRFYVVDLKGQRPQRCFATGRANQRSLLGSLHCAERWNFPSAKLPVLDESVWEASREHPEWHVFRLQGFAADGVAKVGLLDEHDRLVAAVPVVSNTYLRSTGLPTEGVKAIVAYDRSGRQVFCEGGSSCPSAPEPARKPATPPRLVTPPRRGKHLQRGSGDGVVVDIYQPGIALVDLRTMIPRARRFVASSVAFSCARVRFLGGRWVVDTGGAGFRAAAAGRMRFELVGGDPLRGDLPPPYDACEISGPRGHRWNDALGNHAPAEVPLTRSGRLFFEERAVARDLAYFVRSDRVQRIRRSEAPLPALQALSRRYTGRVMQLPAGSAMPPKGAVGFWVGARRLVFAETTPSGRRLFVVAKRGTLKLPSQNLGELAFVF